VGRLDGRVAIVTGAARGQGEAEARMFVDEGARVLVADVLDDAGTQVAADLGDAAAWCHLDVSDPAAWEAAVATAVARFGKVDALVNNAGTIGIGLIEDMPVEEYLRVVHVNQLGCWLGMRAVIGPMRDAGGGGIVNISSTGGLIGIPGLSAYVASKFAIRGMTKVAAAELGHYGIRVNSVHPGVIDTDMGGGPGLTRDEKDALFAHQPVARVGRPEEVAKLVVYLLSDDSAFCTGAEFVIDGGSLAALPTPIPAPSPS
jgi:3alpha(or 20beta)-hydroxysteroid dehydrogenase